MFNLLMSVFHSSLTKRDGVTALEYGVIAAATVTTITAAFALIGPDLTRIFTAVQAALAAAAPAG